MRQRQAPGRAARSAAPRRRDEHERVGVARARAHACRKAAARERSAVRLARKALHVVRQRARPHRAQRHEQQVDAAHGDGGRGRGRRCVAACAARRSSRHARHAVAEPARRHGLQRRQQRALERLSEQARSSAAAARAAARPTRPAQARDKQRWHEGVVKRKAHAQRGRNDERAPRRARNRQPRGAPHAYAARGASVVKAVAVEVEHGAQAARALALEGDGERPALTHAARRKRQRRIERNEQHLGAARERAAALGLGSARAEAERRVRQQRERGDAGDGACALARRKPQRAQPARSAAIGNSGSAPRARNASAAPRARRWQRQWPAASRPRHARSAAPRRARHAQ